MHIFTKRNALVGWIVLRMARRRVRKRLGMQNGHPRLALGAAAATAVGVGAMATRRARSSHPEPAELT
jgi:hypothetical protein